MVMGCVGWIRIQKAPGSYDLRGSDVSHISQPMTPVQVEHRYGVDELALLLKGVPLVIAGIVTVAIAKVAAVAISAIVAVVVSRIIPSVTVTRHVVQKIAYLQLIGTVRDFALLIRLDHAGIN